MIKLGITGGIGSGKTTIASLLQLYHIPVYIADEESKRLTDSSPIIRKELITLFGEELYLNEKLNRPLLASLIFGKQENLTKVNAIIHPIVGNHFKEWCKLQKKDICAIESAILFESGFDKLVDKTLTVYAPREIRIERALQRDSTQTRDTILRRIESQLSDEIKREKADYVLWNDGEKAILPQMEKILVDLQK